MICQTGMLEISFRPVFPLTDWHTQMNMVNVIHLYLIREISSAHIVSQGYLSHYCGTNLRSLYWKMSTNQEEIISI